FIPAHRPFELQWGGDVKFGPKLYIQRVLIMDHCEALLPPYLRFIKGVVDCSDLPLNISREMLQHNPLLEKIKSNIVRSVIKALEEMKAEEEEKYVRFHRELGAILKEGLTRDGSNREKIADLLLFESLKAPVGQYTTQPWPCATCPKPAGPRPYNPRPAYFLAAANRQIPTRDVQKPRDKASPAAGVPDAAQRNGVRAVPGCQGPTTPCAPAPTRQ